jgi:hypothetical protein
MQDLIAEYQQYQDATYALFIVLINPPPLTPAIVLTKRPSTKRAARSLLRSSGLLLVGAGIMPAVRHHALPHARDARGAAASHTRPVLPRECSEFSIRGSVRVDTRYRRAVLERPECVRV